jgi:uncharacterized membrane protein YgdD (TMEM256/DUF423 family)
VSLSERLLLFVAALAGLAGVALSALAAHAAAPGNLDTAARFLLLHAPVLVGLVALLGAGLVRARLVRLAAWILVVGLVLFCGDLARRALAGAALFPMAAPTGGALLMIGWGVIALAALIPRKA